MLAKIKALAAALTICSATSAAAQQTLTFASTLPEKNPLVVQVFEPWVKETNEKAKGLFEINLLNGPTIASHSNVYERVNIGIVDMGWGLLGSVGVPFPRSHVAALPFLVDNPEVGSKALWDLYNEGLLDDDFGDIELVSLLTIPSSGLHFNAPVETTEELAGKKIRTADKISADLVSAFGATPIFITTADTYQAMEVGLVDGFYTGWTGVVLFNLQEVSNYHIDENLGGGPAGIFANSGSLSALSPEARDILREAGDALVARQGAWFGKITGIFRNKVMSLEGQTSRRLSPEEKKVWQEAVQPVIEEWVSTTPNGAQILARYEELQAVHRGN